MYEMPNISAQKENTFMSFVYLLFRCVIQIYKLK
jgi:hypothetical protein